MGSLTPFEDRDVVASGIEMPGASGGLNKALAVNSLEMHHGERGTVVIEFEVVKVRHDKVKDTDVLERIHVLRVDNAAIIDPGLVEELLEQQRRRVEEAKGVQSLPYDDDEADDVDDPADDVEPAPV